MEICLPSGKRLLRMASTLPGGNHTRPPLLPAASEEPSLLRRMVKYNKDIKAGLATPSSENCRGFHPSCLVQEASPHRRLRSPTLAHIKVPGLCLPPSAISSLTPLQLGAGTKGSCEVIIHTTSHLLSSTDNLDHLFLDFPMCSNVCRGPTSHPTTCSLDGILVFLQPLLYLGKDTLHMCSRGTLSAN